MLKFKNLIIYYSLILIMSSGKCGKTENKPNAQPDNDPTPAANPPAQTKFSMFKSLVLGNIDFTGSVKKDDFKDEKNCKEFFDIIELIKKVTNIPASENGIESILGNSKMFDSSKKLTKGNLGPLKNVFESVRPGALNQSTVATLSFESIKTLNDALGNTSKADTFNDKGFFDTTTIGYIKNLYSKSSDSIKNLLPKLDIFTKTQVEYLKNANKDDLKALNDLDTTLAKSLCKAITAVGKELKADDLENLCKIAEVVEFDGKGLEDALKEVVGKDSDHIKAIYDFVTKLKSANSEKLTLYDYYKKEIFEEFTKIADDKVYLRNLFNKDYFQELKDNIKTIKNANEDDLKALNDLDNTLAKSLCEAIAAAKISLSDGDVKKLCKIAKEVKFPKTTSLENALKEVITINHKSSEYLETFYELLIILDSSEKSKLILYDYHNTRILEQFKTIFKEQTNSTKLFNKKEFQNLKEKISNISKSNKNDIKKLIELATNGNSDDFSNVMEAISSDYQLEGGDLESLIRIRTTIKTIDNKKISLKDNVINLTEEDGVKNPEESINLYDNLIDKLESLSLNKFYTKFEDLEAVSDYFLYASNESTTDIKLRKNPNFLDINLIQFFKTHNIKLFDLDDFSNLTTVQQNNIIEKIIKTKSIDNKAKFLAEVKKLKK